MKLDCYRDYWLAIRAELRNVPQTLDRNELSQKICDVVVYEVEHPDVFTITSDENGYREQVPSDVLPDFKEYLEELTMEEIKDKVWGELDQEDLDFNEFPDDLISK